MKKKYTFLGIGLLVGLALVMGAWSLFEQPYQYQGSLIDPPVPAADFQLADQNGGTFQLNEQRGKVVLVFFGYTNCPDVCPVTLSQFQQVKSVLGNEADQVRFVFVTVDPERDTTEVVKSYLNKFDPTFIGLTGTRAELEPIWKAYGVYQEKHDGEVDLDALVDHSSTVYAIDKNGNWRLTYQFGMETQKLTQDVVHLIDE